ncbi:DUF2182 domain-containing protein [Streptomyces sp. TBY4]|uniref:DUF2182 domain-containing protein n=1 Tax=Streptomyces sp. TBY4 TaxID=2962030 RepID=UPI0020B6763A|nr:DUF2182 domain-containing protein [Streptomyces sp. TBY4]MCP3759208.1 DUF2182 domain-containing protein [Streptomyces sp. TBY4]
MPRVRPAPPAPARPGVLLPRRDLALGWTLMALIAVLAWVLTIGQARHMGGTEPGTMGLALPLFLLLWVVMMAAMMLPSVAPVALTWVRGIGHRSAGPARAAHVAEFVGGYLLAWTGFGLLAYGAFLLAGLHQFGPLKRVCLRHCRNPMFQLLRYARFRPWAKDLRVGAHHGLYCVGCCWGLMIVLIPLGFMNVAAMAAVAAVIFLEKLWRWGPWFGRAVGIAFLVLAAVAAFAPFQPWLLPGLEDGGPMGDAPPMEEMRMAG